MATALTQSDIDRLERAIAQGVRTVRYQNQEVTYQSTADMLTALNYAKSALASNSNSQPTPSTYAVFNRN